MTGPDFRDATAADLVAFYGEPLPHPVRAMVADLDGVPVAVAGVMMIPDQPAVFFSDMRLEMRAFPLWILEGARRVVRQFAAPGMLAFACPDERDPGRLLRALGFEATGITIPAGEVFQWAL
jgi:hypothetical protein